MSVTREFKTRKAKSRSSIKVIKTFDPARLNATTDVSWDVVTEENIEEVIRRAMKQKAVAYDIETTGTKHHKNIKLISYALAWKGEGWYFPLNHEWLNSSDLELPKNVSWSGTPEETHYKNIPFDVAINHTRPLLENPDVVKVGSYIQFDYRITKILMGITTKNMMDIGALSRINRSYEKSGLKQLMEYELDRYPWEQDELKTFMKDFKLKFPEDMGKVPVSILGPYNVSDVHYTFVLFARFMNELKKKGQRRIARLESKLIPVLAEMEIRGFPISVPYLTRLSGTLEQQKNKLIRAIHKEAGFEMNPGSSLQLAAFLYGPKDQEVKVGTTIVKGGLNLKPPRMTRGGENSTPKPSTDEKSLRELKDKHPIVDLILDYRGISKLKDTYVDGRKGLLANQKDGFVHPDIFTDAARSGRLAAREPSLMNIPKKSAAIRKAFVANRKGESGYGLLFLDSSQIELRIFAHYLGDAEIIQRMKDGQDFHSMAASVMFNIPIEELEAGVAKGDPKMKDLRSKGKTINFAILYGAGLGQLASQILEKGKPITMERARQLLSLYYESLPSVGEFKNKVDSDVKENGFVSSYFGRERSFPLVFAYAGINHIIQSTAADCLKFGMLRSDAFLQDYRTKILLPIHDEIVMRYDHRDDLFQIIAGVNDAMTDFDFAVPLTTGVAYTEKTWADKKDIDVKRRWLKPAWDSEKEWLAGETARENTSPSEVLKAISKTNSDLATKVIDVRKAINHTMKFQSQLLQWKKRLSTHREVWGEAIRTWKARKP